MKRSALFFAALTIAIATAAVIYTTQEPLGDCASFYDPQKRIEACNALLEREPRNADAYLARSTARATLNQKREAISDLSVSIQIAPTVAKYVQRASMRDRKVELDEAISDYEAALNVELEDKKFASFENRVG